MTPDRHALVSVHPDAILPTLPPAFAAAWRDAGRPAIVRRGTADLGGAASVPLGLPLPPAFGRLRIAFALPSGQIAPRATPDLASLQPSAPAAWADTLAGAAALAGAAGMRVTAYGALLWQGLTGLSYLRAGSDLDLLWHAPGPVEAGFLDRLAALAAKAPMPLDGEVVVAGHGVQWRELARAAPGDRVLCRHASGAKMVRAAAFRTACAA